MEEVRSSSPEKQDCHLKNVFRNMLSNTTLDFISDMDVTDYKHYDQSYSKKIKIPRLQVRSLTVRARTVF